MTKEEIFQLIVKNVCEVLPELEGHNFQPHEKLVNLGANSIDRVEITILTQEALSMEVPKTELVNIENIGELADLFYERYQTA